MSAGLAFVSPDEELRTALALGTRVTDAMWSARVPPRYVSFIGFEFQNFGLGLRIAGWRRECAWRIGQGRTAAQRRGAEEGE